MTTNLFGDSVPETGPKKDRSDWYKLKSKRGYLVAEVVSALQKAIRRGQVELAMFWGNELAQSGFSRYAWARLRIITSEDVGLAEPDMPAQIWALYQMWLADVEKKPGNQGATLFLLHAVALLARARKSRVMDNAFYWLQAQSEWLPELPDEARDMHTKAGREMGRGIEHWWEAAHVTTNQWDDQEMETLWEQRARSVDDLA